MEPDTAQAESLADNLTRTLQNRSSSASLSSIWTQLPQYAADDVFEETAISINTTRHGLPPYAPSSLNTPNSGDTTPQSRPPRYSMLSPPEHICEPSFTGRASTSTTSRESQEDTPNFRYSYPIKPTKPWATLRLNTRDAVPGNPKPLQSRPRVPRIWSCDPVAGSLELDLESAQTIQQITISLTGRIVMSSASEVDFLAYELTLWDKSMGIPLQSDNAGADSVSKKKVDGRFTPGKYTFPFSFPFPTRRDPTSKSGASNSGSIPPPSSPVTQRVILPSTIPLHQSTFPFSFAFVTHPDPIAKPAPLNASSISPAAVGITQSTIPPTPVQKDFPKPGGKGKKMSWIARLSSSGISPAGKTETDPSSPQIQTTSRSATSDVLPPTPHTPASLFPQSFIEKDINPSISYDISVRVAHGRSKGTSRIKTNIVYVPALQPPPAPQKRREAYETSALLPCPMDSPEGWFAYPTHTLFGVGNPDAVPRMEANCTLFLAQPLSYTRGSVIPCFLTISSDDQEVLALLSSPEVPNVRLLRRIRYPMEEDHAAEDWPLEDAEDLTTDWTCKTWISHTTIPTGEIKSVTHEVGYAQWWTPLRDVVQGRRDVRYLEGEIHLSHHLQPSCDFQHFQIEYAVELLSFQTADFESENEPSSTGKSRERDNVLASNPVQIKTLYRHDEPIPTAYSDPPR